MVKTLFYVDMDFMLGFMLKITGSVREYLHFQDELKPCASIKSIAIAIKCFCI